MPDSIFTKIINRELPATIQYEDEKFIVINDIHPIAPVHVLLIPKQSYETLEAVPEDNAAFHAELLQMARKVAKIMKIQENYKIFMNVGKKVQQVHHLHIHVYGGWDKQKTAEELDKESESLTHG